jgi:hypothetical protein
MTLKAVVDSIDAVPEAVRGFYAEKEGKYHLTVEGLVSKDKLDEFRENNRRLFSEKEELAKRFEGIDPDVARKLAAEANKMRDKQLIEAGKVDELVAERTGTMRTDYENKLKASDIQNKTLQQQLESLLIDGSIRDAAAKAGVRPSALEDVLLRGRQTFRLVDGKAVPMDGDKQIFGKSGDVMGTEEWVASLVERAPHLFEPSQGGGARGAGGSAAAGAGVKTIRRSDTKAFLANVKEIASGRVQVVD